MSLRILVTATAVVTDCNSCLASQKQNEILEFELNSDLDAAYKL